MDPRALYSTLYVVGLVAWWLIDIFIGQREHQRGIPLVVIAGAVCIAVVSLTPFIEISDAAFALLAGGIWAAAIARGIYLARIARR